VAAVHAPSAPPPRVPRAAAEFPTVADVLRCCRAPRGRRDVREVCAQFLVPPGQRAEYRRLHPVGRERDLTRLAADAVEGTGPDASLHFRHPGHTLLHGHTGNGKTMFMNTRACVHTPHSQSGVH